MSFDQGYAFLIGVGSHRYLPQLDIPVSAADARAVGEVLSAPAFCGYPPDQVLVVHDTSATREGILSGLRELTQRVTPEDTVFLFFCGHGDYGSDGAYHLITHDTRLAGTKVLAGSGLSQADLIAAVREIPAGQVLMVFNACHAGEISPTLAPAEAFGAQSLPDGASAALLATGRGRIILNACRENQVSYIGQGMYSIFTQALIAGLRGEGLTGGGGYINVFDLYTVVHASVRKQVKGQLGREQEPVLTVLKNVGPFPIALYQGSPERDQQKARQAKLPGRSAVRVVSMDQSSHFYQQIMQIGGVNLAGASGVTIGGDLIGEQRIATGGGAFIGGNVDTGGGAFVGRDQNVHSPHFVAEDRSGETFPDLIAGLRQMVSEAGLDEKVVALFLEELDRLETEWRDPQPARVVLENRLEALEALLRKAASPEKPPERITALLQEALRLARGKPG